MSAASPSSGAPRHLLPRGEKDDSAFAASTVSPSPLVGEGARRADEGAFPRSSKRLTTFAKSMRRNPTEAEAKMWTLLRNRRLAAFKFRRQVPMGPYIADFLCFRPKLIIELDGSQHADSIRDQARDAELVRRGFRLLRIWNNDILARPVSVLDAVWNALQEPAR